ncbi:MAG TPA: hypothetical protein PLX15_03750 [Candidatus Woesearchaeota archaeon]|jgi:hypothetical protein|nr:hypothetical protein [Candidatus Woesearchaeota archaeon]
MAYEEALLTGASAGGVASLLALGAGIFIFSLIFALALYIYTALVLQTIGKKLKVEPTWLAWIPIVNYFYIPMLAGLKWYFGFLLFLSIIPILGPVIVSGIIIWWWWKIAERRGFKGPLALLLLLPIANLVIMGIFAWSEAKKK